MFLSEILLDKNYRKSADSRLGKRGGEGSFRYLHTDFVKLTLETKTIPKNLVLAEVSFTVIFLSQNVYFQVRLVNTNLTLSRSSLICATFNSSTLMASSSRFTAFASE